MYCKICGKLNSDDSKFCINCLADLATGKTKHCPACHYDRNSLDASYCLQCGKPLATIIHEQHPVWDPEPPGGLEYASFWLRVPGFWVDFMVIFSVCYGAVSIILLITSLIFPDLFDSPTSRFFEYYFSSILVLALVVGWLYCAVMESSRLQATLGKLAMGIIVVDLNGDRISFWKATGRYFAKILSWFLFLGFIMAGVSDKKQALHDFISGCLVILKPRDFNILGTGTGIASQE